MGPDAGRAMWHHIASHATSMTFCVLEGILSAWLGNDDGIQTQLPIHGKQQASGQQAVEQGSGRAAYVSWLQLVVGWNFIAT